MIEALLNKVCDLVGSEFNVRLLNNSLYVSKEEWIFVSIKQVDKYTVKATGIKSELLPFEDEIIESDIIWYHNHLRSYRNRYLLETGAANPSARTLNTPEAEIGE